MPSVADNISYNTVVNSVDYTGDQVRVTTQNGERVADRVIMYVPLKILQDRDINFVPAMPAEKQQAIDSITIWEGFKAFIEFSENFYGDGHVFDIVPETDGQKLYYDATHGQNTTQNILGLFSVGVPARQLASLSENDLKTHYWRNSISSSITALPQTISDISVKTGTMSPLSKRVTCPTMPTGGR